MRKNSQRTSATATCILLTAFWGLLSASVALAQSPAAPTAPVTSSASSAAAYTELTEADKALLKQSADRYQKGPGFHTVSEIAMQAHTAGLDVTISESIRLLCKSPHKFRSDVLLKAPGVKTPTRYQIISDGTRLFTYRPGAQRYAVESQQKKGAHKGDFFFATGLLYSLFLNSDNGDNLSDIDALQKAGGKAAIRTEKIGDKEYRAYQITTPPDEGGASSYVFTLFIDPASASVGQINFSGKDDTTEFTVQERIVQIEPTTDFAANVFTFLPPRGTKKVGKIALSDFN